MSRRRWFITGVSSGFGRLMTERLLKRGDSVIGTVLQAGSDKEMVELYPETYRSEVLDVTDTPGLHQVVDRSFADFDRIDVVVSNAGYGLFGAAEELSDEQCERIIATNLTGSIHLIRAVLPYMRAQGGGRIIQMSSYGGQVASPGNSLYHTTKWGIEGFVEAVAQEVDVFGIGMTIVEPGGSSTDFRHGAQIGQLMPEYDKSPAHGFMNSLDPKNRGHCDPVRVAELVIESVDQTPSPLRMLLGTHPLNTTIGTLRKRLEAFEGQRELASSSDYL